MSLPKSMKTNINGWKIPAMNEDVRILVKMGSFQCYVSFQGCINQWLVSKKKALLHSFSWEFVRCILIWLRLFFAKQRCHAIAKLSKLIVVYLIGVVSLGWYIYMIWNECPTLYKSFTVFVVYGWLLADVLQSLVVLESVSLRNVESASPAHSTHMKSWIGGFFRPFCFDVTWEFLDF